MKFDTGANKYRKDDHIHEPWLIQRCTSGKFNPNMKSSEYLKLDYMGAAEFEWGALPAFQREMYSKLDRLIIRMVEHKGVTLFIMTEDKQSDAYADMIRKLIDGNVQTKMGVRLSAREIKWIEPKKKGGRVIAVYDDLGMPFKYDCFWDITNGLAFARSIDVLLNLKISIKNSVVFMDQQWEKK